jgi:hypothetical protein
MLLYQNFKELLLFVSFIKNQHSHLVNADPLLVLFSIFLPAVYLPFFSLSIAACQNCFPYRGGKGNNRFYLAKTFCPFFTSFSELQFQERLFPSYLTGSFVLSSAPVPLFAFSSMNPSPLFKAGAKVIGFLNPPKLFELFFIYFFLIFLYSNCPG